MTAPPASFDVHPALGERATPLVFASPHSGTFYPEDMGAAVDAPVLRSAEDAAVDVLIASGPRAGARLIVGRVGRAYVDLNRAPTDLDPALISDCPPLTPGPKALAGYGVAPRLAGNGAALYARRLTMAEVERRLAGTHRPYHAALGALMAEARSAVGRAVLVDWHSMPARAAGPGGPDVVLGDRYGSSCDAALTRRLRALFEAQGLRVGLNQPYAGGFATQSWGRPDEGYEAIQVELNRRLYWDEANGAPSAGWKRCLSAVERVIAGLGRDFAA